VTLNAVQSSEVILLKAE